MYKNSDKIVHKNKNAVIIDEFEKYVLNLVAKNILRYSTIWIVFGLETYKTKNDKTNMTIRSVFKLKVITHPLFLQICCFNCWLNISKQTYYFKRAQMNNESKKLNKGLIFYLIQFDKF